MAAGLEILLVEDSAWDAELLDLLLRSHGHHQDRLRRAQRLGEALEALRSCSYDLVLLDLTLPDGQGLGVFKAVHELAGHLPIVVLTGIPDPELAIETLRLGAQDYLVKDEIEGIALVRALEHAIERKKLEQEAHRLALEAEQMQLRKSEFMAMVSHELRNPLTGIVGFMQLLGKTGLDPIQREYVELVTTSARSLVDLLNSLLDLSSAEAGHTVIEREPFSVRDCVENVASFCVPQARGKGLEVMASVDPDIPDLLLGDSLRLRQVLINLMGNSLKFTDSGYVGLSARLRSCAETEVLIRFVVEDSGRGIANEKRKTIFMPFKQAESSDRSQGAGLGLAICSQIVEGMGGVLGVESALGQGTAFWFDLPFTVQSGSSLSGCLPGIPVLLADPHGPTRQAIAFVLERMGAVVYQASSREELARIGSNDFFQVVLVHEAWADLRPPATTSRWLVSSYDKTSLGGTLPVSRPLRLHELAGLGRAEEPVETTEEVFPDTEGTLLVVDDDPVCRQLIAAVARRRGLECRVAGSAGEGLDLLAEIEPDLIFVDWNLPDLNGLELARAIRRQGLAAPSIPILAVTGEKLRQIPPELAAVLTKPVALETLESVLVAQLAKVERPPVVDWQVLGRLKKFQTGSNQNLIRELVSVFIDSSRERSEALEGACQRQDWDEVQRIAHRLRGAASSVGANAVSHSAERLEETPGEARLVRRLTREMQRCVQEFQDYLARHEEVDCGAGAA